MALNIFCHTASKFDEVLSMYSFSLRYNLLRLHIIKRRNDQEEITFYFKVLSTFIWRD
jgi:hypothetical protein